MQPTQQAGDTPGHMDLPDLINKNGSIVDESDPAGMADVYQAMMEGGIAPQGNTPGPSD